MATISWNPPVELSTAEHRICSRMKYTGKLFAFLRKHRHELFDAAFQAELATMYSDKPRGTRPIPPALLAMVTILQAYGGVSDAGAVHEAMFDKRWQMVLNCLGEDDAPFSQGVLVDFRRRLIAKDLDRRLLERTVELAKTSGGFGHRALRVALDSAPLWGAARVEDTFNLIGHAAEVVCRCAAKATGLPPSAVRKRAGLLYLGGCSTKASLDVDWTDEEGRQEALERLVGDVRRLRAWVETQNLSDSFPEVAEALDVLASVLDQDIEPDPDGGPRIRRGVAKERRVSIADPDMRHGRKSKSTVINGYKRHIAKDIDTGLILAATVRPANQPEHAAVPALRMDVENFGDVQELHIDRGYLAATWVSELEAANNRVISKAWRNKNRGMFGKEAFDIDLERGVVSCPAGNDAPIRFSKATFPKSTCEACPLRERCTSSRSRGRTITIHRIEPLLIRLRDLQSTKEGRAKARERVTVEHSLAHVCRRQGRQARYVGERLNTLDVRRTCAVENLHTAARLKRVA